MFNALHDKLDDILDAKKFIGRAPEQTVEFIQNEIDPILKENKSLLGQKGNVKV
jgi:adenylosuccinate lyase